MKKLRHRSNVVLIFALAVAAGLALFAVTAYYNGGDWAAYQANGNVYRAGKLTKGTVTARDGEFLAELTPDGIIYPEDELCRRATVHVVGDRAGNVAFGALRQFRKELVGWDYVNGINGGGGTLALSISLPAQETAYAALEGLSGAVAVVDYTTGEIVCCATSPGFDPEDTGEELAEGAYMNRAVGAAYTPGSIFKLVTMTAAIENIPDLYERRFHCDGSVQMGDGTVKCLYPHGDMMIEDAMAMSCNCTFAALAVEMGGKTMASCAARLGISTRIEYDGGRLAAGKYTDAGDNVFNLAWSGAGQSDDLAVPMTMARLAAAIANGGEIRELSMRKGGAGGRVRLMWPETAEKLASVMSYNVSRTYGAENFPGLMLHAKSGTAEVGGDRKPNSWFCGFIENEGFPYAFCVVIENGGWGAGEAAETAKTVLNELCSLN